ncbi:MAG: hypothetical protein VXZ58_09780, partial [Actinomycetota bacterium]|nr:hypothetical protein [Actinomycetota bacterium]
MDSEASYVNLLDILGGVNIPEVHTLRVVDGMVGQSVAQTLQFLDYVRKHSSNLTAACVINILRLILIDAKYCHYPDLDLLIFGLIGESSGKAMNQCLDNRRGGLLVRSLACEALRVWNSHIQLVEIPDKCAAMEERMKAVRSLVDSMESDTAWDSAASIFAMRLRGPQALILQKRLEKGKISNNPISGDDEVLKGSALSESECQFMLGAMRTFSALDEDVLMEEYRENGKIASVNSKKRTQDGSDQAINAKKFKVIQQEDHYQELDGIDQ